MYKTFFKLGAKKLKDALELGKQGLEIIDSKENHSDLEKLKTAIKLNNQVIEDFLEGVGYKALNDAYFYLNLLELTYLYDKINGLYTIYFRLPYYRCLTNGIINKKEYDVFYEHGTKIRFSFMFLNGITEEKYKSDEYENMNEVLMWHFYENLSNYYEDVKSRTMVLDEKTVPILSVIKECVDIAFLMYDVPTFPREAISPIIKGIHKRLESLGDISKKLSIPSLQYPKSYPTVATENFYFPLIYD